MATCEYCKKEMLGALGCVGQEAVLSFKRQVLPAVPYTDLEGRCPDCG